MHILIVGVNYRPESTSIGPYTADLAEYLSERGHSVRVVTGFPLAPQWRIWKEYRKRWFMRELINGVPVTRTFLLVPSDPRRVLGRILFDSCFALSSLLGGLVGGPFDLVVTVSPPLQLGITGWLLALVRGAALFFHIQDLVPDAAVATRMMDEGSIGVRMARSMERFIYRRAAGIGVISEAFRENLIAKGVPAAKIRLLPNGIDLESLKPHDRNNGFRQRQGIKPTDFLVMYSGSVALKQGLDTFVDAASEIKEHDPVLFYLIGEGPYLEDLKARANGMGLTNFHFLPLQPRAGLASQLAAADALVITQRPAVTDFVFPGKLLYYMAVGRPILAAVSPDSVTGRFVSQHQVGIVVPSEDPRALARAIEYLRRNPAEGIRMGHNGRQVVTSHFERRMTLAGFEECLKQMADHD